MADDSPTQIDRNKAVALKYGMKVLGAFQNGEQLFAALPALRPQVTLLDVTMRGMTGIETAAAIRKEGIQTKIILVTSMGQKMISDPQAVGADYLLVKPFPDEWFLTAVLEVLDNNEKDFDLQHASVIETPATDEALPIVTTPVVYILAPPTSGSSSGSSDGGEPSSGSSGALIEGDYLTTANVNFAAGGPSGPVVTPAQVPNATSSSAHVYSITVYANPAHQGSIIFSDGEGGPILAIVPANFPGGDINLTAPKFFGTSVYATPNGSGPACSIGVGP